MKLMHVNTGKDICITISPYSATMSSYQCCINATVSLHLVCSVILASAVATKLACASCI
jgi:hypothetical protein